jgi:tRNA pseudouridine38-40 synthase
VRHIKLIIQYDGTDYSGWQIQSKNEKCKMKNVKLRKGKSIVTIQGILQEKIKKITGEDAKVIGAARTDAGVHAFTQVAAFRTESDLEPHVFLRALNANLPHDIRVIDAAECSADFHPRYSAKSKTYSYIISSTGAYSVFLKRYSWQIPYRLDCDSMREAAKYFIGKHDFSSFRASGCSSKNSVRTIFKIEVAEFSSIDFMSFKFNAPVVKISIEADAFLRHMARNIVGTLVEVGRGKLSPIDIKEILESKDRRLAAPTAPAQGLFLERIEY